MPILDEHAKMMHACRAGSYLEGHILKSDKVDASKPSHARKLRSREIR